MHATSVFRGLLFLLLLYGAFLALMFVFTNVKNDPPPLTNSTTHSASPILTIVVDQVPGRSEKNATWNSTTPVYAAQCTNFYESECDLDAPSMLTSVYMANEAVMAELVPRTGTYRACMSQPDHHHHHSYSHSHLVTPAPADADLGTWMRANARLPLQVQVETALDRPAQVLVLAWDVALYEALQARSSSMPAADTALVLFPTDIFGPALHASGAIDDTDLDAYTNRYLPWHRARALLPPVWRTALETAFPEALDTHDVSNEASNVLVWQHPSVTPAALRAVAEAWTAQPEARNALHEATEALLWETAHTRGYQALESRWARQAVRGPVPNPPNLPNLPNLPNHPGVYNLDASETERACWALAEAVERPGLNQAFLAHTGMADGVRTSDVADLVVEVAHAVAGLLHAEAAHLDMATRDAAIRKLETAAVYVLGPSSAAKRTAATLNALPPDDLASRVMAWRAQTHARAARQLATPHAAWRRHLGQHKAHTVRYATVNAWYAPSHNAITVPPGILQEPVYVSGADHRSERLAHVGMILAHELGHSLDVHGRLFDHEGCLVRPLERGWWTAHDTAHLDARMGCLADDFGHPCGRPDYGLHTIGEDTADQLGLRASYALLVTSADGNRTESERARAFFAAYARLWCARTLTHEVECRRVEEDVHALPQHRVNKSLRQLTIFAAAFGCSQDDAMVNDEPCLVY